MEGLAAEWKMKTASLQTPFAYNLMNGDECYESTRSEVVSRRGRRGDTRRLTTPCGEDRYCFFVPRKPLEEMGASYILMNAGTGRSCKILWQKMELYVSLRLCCAPELHKHLDLCCAAMLLFQRVGGLGHNRLSHDRPSVISRKLHGHLQLLVATTR